MVAIPIWLRELGGARRNVFLSGHDLPRQSTSAGMGVTVTGSSTYYPGSRIPTSQVWAVEQEPIRFAGIFDDRRRGIPGWAVSQATLLNDIASTAHHIEFRYGPWIRVCRWGSFRFTPQQLNQIHYEIKLVALHDGTADFGRITNATAWIPTVGLALNAVALAQDALNSFNGNLLDTLISPLIDPLVEPIRVPLEATVNSLREINENLGIVSRSPGRTRKAQGGDMVGRAKTASTQLAQAQAQARAASVDDQPVSDFDKAVLRLEIMRSLRAMQQGQSELRKLILRLEAIAAQDDRIETYVVADGQSLHRIALARYGTHEKAREILAENGLLNWSLSAGQVLRLRNAPERPRSRPVVAG